MIKHVVLYIGLVVVLISCNKQDASEDAIARVYDKFLYEEDIVKSLPDNLTKEDSVLIRNSIINDWATEELLLNKAKINLEDENDDINKLVEDYKKDLLIEKYKQAVLQQELDTVITQMDLDEYYENNKNIFKLNEDLVQLKYIYFNHELNDEKEFIKLFKQDTEESDSELIDRELEFNSFNFNDSIWVSYKSVQKKLPWLKEENNIKKDQFIQKEDSLGVYLVAVKNVLYRNDIAPKSYVIPSIKQMILHKRKLELTKKIEQTLVNDAINKKQFEQY
ncbi:MAG: hypothetical protein OEM04_00840 [Flavobacteriaceae bacterium]|nr:hypothetical protein [Flavobacteriaceae bacterium]